MKNRQSIVDYGIQIGKKFGNIITEFFVGKQPTKEEKEERIRRKTHLRNVMKIQQETIEQKEIELAKRGLYKPSKPKNIKKNQNMLLNFGKNNPLGDFQLNNHIDSPFLNYDSTGIEKNNIIKPKVEKKNDRRNRR